MSTIGSGIIGNKGSSAWSTLVGTPTALLLDQTTPQTVINGVPIFDAGIKSNGPIILKSGQKLVFDGA
jgi:hypothetical protein